MEDSLPKFNVKITEDHLHDGVRELISKIRPEWPPNKLHYKIFTDGITNRLIGVYNKDRSEMILIRIFGDNTDLFIDRNIECRNMKIMYKHGLSAPVYGTFSNGVCYGYSPGTVLDEKMVRDKHIATLIAENMARMHTLKPLISAPNQFDQNGPQACLFPGLKKFVALLKSALSLKTFKLEQTLNKKFKNLCDIEKFEFEVEFLERTLTKLQSPIVFCHNDLLLKNIVYDSNQNNVTFIDFEYSDYNYQAFDIANHFCEFCGVSDFDERLFPDKEFQLKWLKIYLKKWHSLTNNNNNDEQSTRNIEQEVKSLHDIVNQFTMASHLYWGTWALVQVFNSSIDFDYVQFAYNRLEQYFKQKHELHPLMNNNNN